MDNPVPYSPTSIERLDEKTIQITWTDGEVTAWTAGQLRDACPCATCREKRTKKNAQPDGNPSLGLPVLSPAEAQPLTIAGMQPVGTYAYNVAFSDGHSSGLFTFARLRREQVE